MTLTSYLAYKNNIAATPTKFFKDNLQQLSNRKFDNGIIYTITEELTAGTGTYTNIAARVESVIDNKTGEKLNDDFKKIIFKDNTHATGIGYRYQFDNYTWLGVQGNNIKDITASIIVRRCNHTLKWYDSNRVLRQEPCIVDYSKLSIMNDKVIDTQSMSLAEKKSNIIMQANNYSRALDYNQRFIFNKIAWRIIGFDMVSYPGLVILNLEQHQIDKVADDFVNEIANANLAPSPSDGKLW